MRRGVVFCKIIGQILVSWAPIDMKLTLFDSVFDPIKSVRLCIIVSLLYPVAVVLLLCCQFVMVWVAVDVPFLPMCVQCGP
jgi:hypothetical protein